MKKEIIARFVKDQKIPIMVYSEPYFSHFLMLYEKDFGTKSSYDMLVKTLESFDKEEEFLEEYYRVRDAVINAVESLSAYQEFLGFDMSTYSGNERKFKNVTKGDVYKLDNVGKFFVSIDMKTANFQALRLHNPDLVFGCKTYDEFIARFTNLEYIRRSKYTRQVVFGNMNPKRQVTIQRFYINEILNSILDNKQFAYLTADNLVTICNDEIVFEVDSLIPTVESKNIVRYVKENYDIDVSVTSYKLNNIGGKDFFVQEKADGTISFKKVPSVYFAQVYKKYKGEQVDDFDLAFYYEGYLSKFMEPIFKDETD